MIEKIHDQPLYAHRTYPDIVPTEHTLESWIREWAPRRVRGLDGISQNQMLQRLACITKLIGDVPLQCLSLEIIQDSINKFRQQNTFYKSTHYAYSFLLTSALNDAVCRHYLAFNPCMGMVLPKIHYQHRSGLSDDELVAFYRLSENTPYSLFFRTMIAAALRIGEVQALTWRQINLTRESMLIDQQIVLREGNDGITHYTLVHYTKYRKRQTIYPQKGIFTYLTEEKKRQQAACAEQNIPWNENAYVFPGADTQSFRANVTTEFHIIATAIGRPELRPHDLRHTGARLKLKETNDVWAVRDLLRHSRLGTTMEYLYATPDDMREAVNKLDSWYNTCIATAPTADPG